MKKVKTWKCGKRFAETKDSALDKKKTAAEKRAEKVKKDEVKNG